MTDRERLVELIFEADKEAGFLIDNRGTIDEMAEMEKIISEKFADKILADGWMKPPCKVGDVVYSKRGCFYLPHATQIKLDAVIACEVIAIKKTKIGRYILLKPLLEETFGMRSANKWFPFSAIGKTVFLTREEAEKAMKGGESDA